MPLGLVTKLIAAFLVLLGTSGQGLAAMVCGTPACPKTAALKPEPPKAESCCAKKKAKPEPTKECCCKVKPAPATAKLDAKVTVPTGLDFDLTLPEPSVTLPVTVKIETAARITAFTDPSPPDPIPLPDRGRAPPAL